jgi:preprotein translocase subunit SecG
MTEFLTIVHVIVSMALIGIVLLQHGKGADMGAAFGGSSQTLFGSGGATTFLSKLTAGAAVIFMVTSLSLGILGQNGSDTSSVIDQVAPPSAVAPMAAPAPITPAAPPTEETK